MRLGILGGTFDPVHQGHIELARKMRDTLRLGTVRFMPALYAPHKLTPPVADGWHRVAMLALATLDEPGFEVSTEEMHMGRATYTIETISRLRSELPVESELFFLIGADMFAEIHTWKDFSGLLDKSHFAALSRPGFDLSIEHLPEWAKARVARLNGPLDTQIKGPNRIFLCAGAANEITSTGVRAKASRGEPLKSGVPAAVARYIEKHRLYLETDDPKGSSTATIAQQAARPVGAHRR